MRSLKVLILEHNPFQLMALHQMLNAIGIYDVLTAPTLASALGSLARRGRVDIVICDPQACNGEGLALIRHLAAEQRAQALILLGRQAPDTLADVNAILHRRDPAILGRLHTPVSAVLMRGLLDSYLSAQAEAASA